MPKKKKVTTELVNFYELDDVKAFQKQSYNPHYDIHNIKIPFRMCIIGASGSMKSNCVLNILKTMNQTFNYVELFCRNKDEPLYNYLQTKIDTESLKVYEGLEELNKRNLDDYYKNRGQTLIIFDDLCLERNQSKISELFIRGRKIGGGISLVYISQKYFAIPKEARGQLSYIILKKISGKNDLARILSETSLSASKEELLKMYKYSTNNSNTSFLMVDLEAPQDRTYRMNFDVYLNPEDFK